MDDGTDDLFAPMVIAAVNRHRLDVRKRDTFGLLPPDERKLDRMKLDIDGPGRFG